MFILTQGPLVQNYSTTSEAPANAFVYSCHRPLKVGTDGVHACVRELVSIDFSTLQPVLYGIILVRNNVRL